LCKSTSREKVAKELLFRTFNGNAATRHGKQHEDIAKEQLKKVMGKNIKSTELIVNHGFLAPSPDGLVDDNALVEIKSSISKKYESRRWNNFLKNKKL
jgi:hypothetical protein